MILDLEIFFLDHHVARVINEMVESNPDQQLFAHYTRGRNSYAPQMMLNANFYG